MGSVQAGPKIAAIISVVESCRRLGVPVKDYFLDVLPGTNRRKLSEVRLTVSGALLAGALLAGSLPAIAFPRTLQAFR